MEDGKIGEEIGQNQQQGTMNQGMEHQQQMEGPVLARVERLDEVGNCEK